MEEVTLENTLALPVFLVCPGCGTIFIMPWSRLDMQRSHYTFSRHLCTNCDNYGPFTDYELAKRKQRISNRMVRMYNLPVHEPEDGDQ